METAEKDIKIHLHNCTSNPDDDVSFQEYIKNHKVDILITKPGIKLDGTWVTIMEDKYSTIFRKTEVGDIITNTGKLTEGIIWFKVLDIYIYICDLLSTSEDNWMGGFKKMIKRSAQHFGDTNTSLILTGHEIKEEADLNKHFWDYDSHCFVSYKAISRVNKVGTSQIVIKRKIGFWNTNRVNARTIVDHMNSVKNNNLISCDEKSADFTARLTRACYNSIPDKEFDWEKLCVDVEANPYLFPTFLGNNSIKPPPKPENEVPGGIEAVINQVFNHFEIPEIRINDGEIPPVTEEELLKAAKKLRKPKSSGPDGIPYKILKDCVSVDPDDYLKTLNECFQRGIFPQVWKQMKLKLIYKGKNKNINDPSSYRPICLLNSPAKLAERVILNRIVDFIDANKLCSENQFACTRGKPPKGLIVKIREIANSACETQQFCIAVALDVRNAFNTISPARILKFLTENNFPGYITRIIKSYFEDRTVIYENSKGEHIERSVRIGAPQGSVLGPLMWKIGFDGFLKLQFPEDVQIFSCNDDVIFTVTKSCADEVETTTKETMQQISAFFDEAELEMAEEKIGAVWLNCNESPQNSIIEIKLQKSTITIQPEDSIKFLDIHISSDATYTPHVKEQVKANHKFKRELEKLIRNCAMEIPKEYAERLIKTCLRENLLNACPVWAEAMRKEDNVKLLSEALRGLERNVQGTMVSVELEVKERKRVWDEMENGKTRKQANKIARADTLKALNVGKKE